VRDRCREIERAGDDAELDALEGVLEREAGVGADVVLVLVDAQAEGRKVPAGLHEEVVKRQLQEREGLARGHAAARGVEVAVEREDVGPEGSLDVPERLLDGEILRFEVWAEGSVLLDPPRGRQRAVPAGSPADPQTPTPRP